MIKLGTYALANGVIRPLYYSKLTAMSNLIVAFDLVANTEPYMPFIGKY